MLTAAPNVALRRDARPCTGNEAHNFIPPSFRRVRCAAVQSLCSVTISSRCDPLLSGGFVFPGDGSPGARCGSSLCGRVFSLLVHFFVLCVVVVHFDSSLEMMMMMMTMNDDDDDDDDDDGDDER